MMRAMVELIGAMPTAHLCCGYSNCCSTQMVGLCKAENLTGGTTIGNFQNLVGFQTRAVVQGTPTSAAS